MRFLPVGESDVELVQPTARIRGCEVPRRTPPASITICFEVDDIDDLLVQLKAKGVR